MSEELIGPILAGDWWFRRSESVPSLVSGDLVPLHKLSADAARLCAHRVSLQLVGVDEWLRQLQQPAADQLRTSRVERRTMRTMMGVSNDSQWGRMLRSGVRNWSPDFLTKLALLRNVEDPSPATIDWAAHFTWLTFRQQQLSDGTIPLGVFAYAACAMERCDRFEPLDDDNSQSVLQCLHEVSANFEHWQRRALARCLAYTRRSFPLLSGLQVNELRHYVTHEPDLFFRIAEDFSRDLHNRLAEWGIVK
ncbi:hypothetical protein [Fuerstiella marisgermanici]|uniref:hypothetical protein n=1 Tax=Fuerstiella marisgermanici TaxID=1891926 RepID=UPI0011AB3DBF|nr:hypothetical protein [Fuerstiella marisgermanici]